MKACLSFLEESGSASLLSVHKSAARVKVGKLALRFYNACFWFLDEESQSVWSVQSSPWLRSSVESQEVSSCSPRCTNEERKSWRRRKAQVQGVSQVRVLVTVILILYSPESKLRKWSSRDRGGAFRNRPRRKKTATIIDSEGNWIEEDRWG